MLKKRALRTLRVLIPAALWLLARGPLFAFQSVERATVTAVVVLTQAPLSNAVLHIAHNPAQRALRFSRGLGLVGVASHIPISLSSFAGSKPSPGGDPLQVTLTYKIANTGIQKTMQMQGTDPFIFSFTVPPADILTDAGSTPGLAYRLDALDLLNGKTGSFPSTDPTQFQPVNVGPMTFHVPAGGISATYSTGVSDGHFGYLYTRLDFPPSSGPVDVTIDEAAALGQPNSLVPAAFGSRFLSPYPEAYNITTTPPNYQFPVPVTLTMWYPSSQQTAGAPSLGMLNFSESQLAAYAYDQFGSEWRPASANQSLSNHTFTTRIIQGSYYGIFPSAALQPEDFRPPQKIITPNGDGINDVLEFGNLDADATIDIYNINGRRVRHLQGVFIWDARDDSGSIVESGVYIYQYSKDGKVVSGVVAVAK